MGVAGLGGVEAGWEVGVGGGLGGELVAAGFNEVLADWEVGVGGGLGGELGAGCRGLGRSSVAVGSGLKGTWDCIQAMSGEPLVYRYGKALPRIAGASLFELTRMPARRGVFP